jgi:glycosyltransferase 2 family protein
MKVVTKRAALFLLKCAVLAVILIYAGRQMQLEDELALPASGSPKAARLVEVRGAEGPAFELSTVGGGSVRLAPGARLEIVARPAPSPGPTRSYEVQTKEGARIVLDRTAVEGESAPFELRPGLRTLFRDLDWAKLCWAFAIFGPAIFLMAVRWQALLVASGVAVPFFTVVRLHYMAFFLNSFMPGGAGGDIVKAVYVTRYSERKAEAATMVLIDRVVGVMGLLVMAGIVVVLNYGKMRGIALQVGLLTVLLAMGALLFFSATFRKLVRYDWLLDRLPRREILKKVDQALYALRDRKGTLAATLGITIFLQLLEVVGVYLAGGALGMNQATFSHYLVFVPIGYLFNAIPISFGGIGLMEGAYLKLFHDAGAATASQGFMLGILARLIVIGWSLPGALSALFPPAQAADEVGAARAQGGTS